MFYSTYLPVNMQRNNCAVYSADKKFPEDLLLLAHKSLTEGLQSGVIMEDNIITFLNYPDICWTISEVYLAYTAYEVAKKNNFSYYAVYDKTDNVELFISKSFVGHRIIVNAFTFGSVLITSRKLVSKVATMIDGKFEHIYCMDVFDVIKNVERGDSKYLPAVVVNRGTVEEYTAFSPIQTMFHDITTFYATDLLEEFKAVSEDHDLVTESVKYVDGKFLRYDLSYWVPMPQEHIDYIISTYYKMLEKKSSYVAIEGEDCKTHLYFSTNGRYLVNARTFECVIIKNMHTRNLLTKLASMDAAPVRDISLAWMLAKTE